MFTRRVALHVLIVETRIQKKKKLESIFKERKKARTALTCILRNFFFDRESYIPNRSFYKFTFVKNVIFLMIESRRTFLYVYNLLSHYVCDFR